MGFFSGISNLLFPPRCAFCRRILKRGGSGMCSSCEKAISYTENGGRQTGDFFTVCVSPLYYEGIVRESILRFKFKEATAYASLFGRLIADCIRKHLAGCYDLISWVPLSAKRLKKRGYDQAMLLAMAAALELDDVAVETLIKHIDVPAQSGVGSKEKRKANIAGAYRVSDPELVQGRRILLIDDIVTSGSTLSECARTLLQAGAAEVVCATLARARD
ncbi:MAG: ComF family protein [Oscillospiraceae bacterium]|jgi:competence protein ComFC